MKDKYYTPTADEFHIGFEFERRDPISREWRSVTLTNNSIIAPDPDPDVVRVKYLDRDDIEDLGFDYYRDMEPIPNRNDCHVSHGYLFEKEDRINQFDLYLFSDGIVWIGHTKECGFEGYVFKGLVKNKSELKRILTQIGIQ